MKNYIFTKTDSEDRTNIMSEFPLWNKEMFLENVKLGNSSGRYRYGQIGGYVSLLKDMRLEEFLKVFSEGDFTKSQVTKLFRKEISEKFGEHLEKAKLKPLPSKILEVGCVYEDFSGGEWLYYGKVKRTITVGYLKNTYGENKVISEEGYGFNYVGSVVTSVTILKSPKRLPRKLDQFEKTTFKDVYVTVSKVHPFGNRERKTVVEFITD